MTYMIAVFTDDEGVESTAVIPDNWYDPLNETAYWPTPFKTSVRINSAALKKEEPGSLWEAFSVRVIFTGTWVETKKKLRLSEETSDLMSEHDVDDSCKKHRKKRATKRLISSDGSDHTDVEPPKRVHEEDSPSDFTNQDLPIPPSPLFLAAKPSIMPKDTSERGNSGESSLPLQIMTPSPRTRPVDFRRQDSTPRCSAPSPSMAVPLRDVEVRDARIFTTLENILIELKKLQENQQELNNNVRRWMARTNSVPVPEVEKCLEGLPLKTRHDTYQHNDELADDQKRQTLIKYLGDLGGSSLKKCVARIMETLFSNELAKECNYSGMSRKGEKLQKFGFKNLRLDAVVFNAVKRNPATSSCTKSAVESELSNWLSNFRDRDGDLKARRKSPAKIQLE